jgi:hypothetical protein
LTGPEAFDISDIKQGKQPMADLIRPEHRGDDLVFEIPDDVPREPPDFE